MSNRITWNWSGGTPTSTCQRLRNLVAQGDGVRQIIADLNAILQKYGADWAALAADLGVSEGTPYTNTQKIYNLVIQAYGEVIGTVTTPLNAGDSSGLRQLIDTLG